MIATPDARKPMICQACRADEMSCGVKAGLSGRRCCDECGHDDDHDDLHREEHHDIGRDDVDHHVHDHHDHDDVDHPPTTGEES